VRARKLKWAVYVDRMGTQEMYKEFLWRYVFENVHLEDREDTQG